MLYFWHILIVPAGAVHGAGGAFSEGQTMRLAGRRRDVLMTVGFNIVLQAVTMLCGFVLPPLIVRTFGSEVNGMVASISQFIACLNLVEAGIGGAAIASLYRPLAEGDADRRNAILSAAATFYRKSGRAFVLLVLLLALAYPLAVGGEVDRVQAGLMVLVLGITGTAEFFLIGKYRVLLTADRKVSVISAVQMLALLASTLLSVALIEAGCGIVMVKLASALVYMGRYVFITLYVRSHYSGLDFRAPPDTESVSQSRSVLVHQVGGFVVFNSPLVIITLFCPLSEASVYAVYAMVFTALGNLLGSLSNGMQAFFGESLIKNSIGTTQSAFGLYETLFYAATGWTFSCAHLLTVPFMAIYTRSMTDALYVRPALAVLFVAVGVANFMRKPCDLLITAAGHFRQTQWRSLLESAINVVASVVLTLRFGTVGVLLGGICSYLYRTLDIIIYANVRILRRSPLYSLAKIGGCLAVCAVMVLLLGRGEFFPQTYLEWLAKAAARGAVLAAPGLCLAVLLIHSRRGSGAK